MPEHADLSIASDSRCRVRHRLIHSKILMIGRHDLCQASIFMIEALKVVQDIYQPLLLKDATKECFVIGNLVRFILAIYALPLHKAVGLGGDGTSLGSQHIAGYAEGIKNKQPRAFLLILFDLRIGIRFVRLVSGG